MLLEQVWIMNHHFWKKFLTIHACDLTSAFLKDTVNEIFEEAELIYRSILKQELDPILFPIENFVTLMNDTILHNINSIINIGRLYSESVLTLHDVDLGKQQVTFMLNLPTYETSSHYTKLRVLAPGMTVFVKNKEAAS